MIHDCRCSSPASCCLPVGKEILRVTDGEERPCTLWMVRAKALLRMGNGLSLPSVTLGLNKNFFSDGQAYVGLSRATASALHTVRLESRRCPIRPGQSCYTYNAVDLEKGEKLEGTELSRIFKRGTNFPSKVICNVGAKVMFLTNSMLADKGIANGSIGVITDILDNDAAPVSGKS